jgi:hypothetical protein
MNGRADLVFVGGRAHTVDGRDLGVAMTAVGGDGVRGT